jgi:hypothetical protein
MRNVSLKMLIQTAYDLRGADAGQRTSGGPDERQSHLAVSASGVMAPLRRKRPHSNTRPVTTLHWPIQVGCDWIVDGGKGGYLLRTLGSDSTQGDAAWRRQAPVVRQLAEIFVEGVRPVDTAARVRPPAMAASPADSPPLLGIIAAMGNRGIRRVRGHRR